MNICPVKKMNRKIRYYTKMNLSQVTKVYLFKFLIKIFLKICNIYLCFLNQNMLIKIQTLLLCASYYFKYFTWIF